jgi:Domain of unknown function (DUF4150)
MPVYANFRSIVHKADGLQHLAAIPDVCLTPTPLGPIPVPYVNMAANADMLGGSVTVKIEGGEVGVESSKYPMSKGDEAGVLGGLVSGLFMGECSWVTKSCDVKIEGQGVVRFLDVILHNGSSPNTAFIGAGTPAT